MKPKRQTPGVRVPAAQPATLGGARYEIAASGNAELREEPGSRKAEARVVSATEAARNFSDLINRVSYQGETYVVERGGRPMCTLAPVEARRCTGGELLAVLAGLARPAEEFLAAVEEVTRHQANIEPSAWEK